MLERNTPRKSWMSAPVQSLRSRMIGTQGAKRGIRRQVAVRTGAQTNPAGSEGEAGLRGGGDRTRQADRARRAAGGGRREAGGGRREAVQVHRRAGWSDWPGWAERWRGAMGSQRAEGGEGEEKVGGREGRGVRWRGFGQTAPRTCQENAAQMQELEQQVEQLKERTPHSRCRCHAMRGVASGCRACSRPARSSHSPSTGRSQ